MTYKLSDFEVNDEVQELVDVILNKTGESFSSALVVGWRESSYNDLFHNLKLAGYDDIDVIDIFEPNIKRFVSKGVSEVTARVLDVRDAYAVFGEEAKDVVIFQQGPEHLEKEEGIKVINELKKIAKAYVIVETPEGFYHQDALDGNSAEKHLSEWYFEDYHSLSFVTTPGEEAENIIGIWKKEIDL